MTWQTRTVWMFGITALLGLAAGCGVDDDDDSSIAVAWDLSYVGDGQGVDCAGAGAPTVRLQAVGRRGGEALTFDFPCTDRRGITTRLTPDFYDVTLSLLDTKGVALSAVDGSTEVRRHGATFLPNVTFSVQSFLVSWSLVLSGPNGAMRTVTCDEVGVKTVEFEAQLAGEGVQTFPFDCQPGLGITTGVRTGSYSLRTRLLGLAGQVLTETPLKNLLVGTSKRPEVPEVFSFK